MPPRSLHLRVAAALAIAAAVLVTVLGSLVLLRPRGDRDGPGVRLHQVGGVYRLVTGRGGIYRLHLPRDWGVAAVPAERWVQVARERSCEAAVLSALEPAPGAAAAPLKDRASALLWQVLGRSAEPGGTITTPVRLRGHHAAVAADLHARVAVLAVEGARAGRRPRTAAIVVQGVAGPGRTCDHRLVRLTPEHLGNLVAGVEDAGPALR